PLGGLEVEPARVERDALADEGDASGATARGRVREVDELRRLGAPGRHAEERAHAHAAAVGAVIDAERKPVLLRDLCGGPGEPGHDHPALARVDVRHLPRFRLEPLGIERSLDVPPRRAVEAGERVRQLRLLGVEPDDERVGRDLVEPLGDDRDLHALAPPLRAWARWIMSTSPSVVSSSATRSISTHRASAASLPALSRVDSGYAR